jgi:hypothetical protein
MTQQLTDRGFADGVRPRHHREESAVVRSELGADMRPQGTTIGLSDQSQQRIADGQCFEPFGRTVARTSRVCELSDSADV